MNVIELESNLEKLIGAFLNMLPHLISALVIAAVTWFFGNWIIKIVQKLLHQVLVKRDTDTAVQEFLEKFTALFLKVLLFILVIGQLGIQTSSLVAMLGAAGLAVGMALQGSLANFAGGVLILVFKPFKTGDYIASSSGPAGTVKNIDIFHTKLITPQNQLIVVPNGELSNSNITNYSNFDTRTTWFDIDVSYDADLREVKKLLLETVSKHPKSLETPAPAVVVTSLEDSAVRLSIRVAAKNSDYWGMLEDLIIDCKEALEKANIEIPYPQAVVYQRKE